MLRFFPFGESFDVRMGGRPLGADEPLCDVEREAYLREVALKRDLLAGHPGEYFSGGSATGEAQWEVLALVLEDLAAGYPEWFGLEKQGIDWRWRNRLLGEEARFCLGEAGSLPLEALDWVGRQVQEDLVLVSVEDGQPFIGGQLCFANGWSIPSHLGLDFIALHSPTPPVTRPAIQAGRRLLEALKPGKTVWRMNWSFKLSAELDLSTRQLPRYATLVAEQAPRLTPQTAGEAIFLRVERQTLTRLPRARVVLFGIHTYVHPLAEAAAEPERARGMLKVIASAPQEVLDYKGLSSIAPVLKAYLEARAG